MRLRFPLGGGLTFLIAAALAVSQEAQQFPNRDATIRVTVDRVDLGVTVTDSKGRFIPGLRRQDFRVFDNTKEQPIVGFSASGAPARIVFLVEDSTSDILLAKLGKSPYAAADNLLNEFTALDQVAVVTYSDLPRLVLDFTSDPNEARRTLQDINLRAMRNSSTSGSNWMNLLSSLTATMDWLGPAPGSKAIVLVSSGIDTSPKGSWELIEERFKLLDIHVLGLSILGDFRKLAKRDRHSQDQSERQIYLKNATVESDQLLLRLSKASGGRAYFPKNRKDFDKAYGDIAQLVRGEYRLEFIPSAHDNQTHSILVKVKRYGCQTDYRSEYFAPAATGQIQLGSKNLHQ